MFCPSSVFPRQSSVLFHLLANIRQRKGMFLRRINGDYLHLTSAAVIDIFGDLPALIWMPWVFRKGKQNLACVGRESKSIFFRLYFPAHGACIWCCAFQLAIRSNYEV